MADGGGRPVTSCSIAAGGVGITRSAATAMVVASGFSFDFYGTRYTNVTVGANGGLVFGGTSLGFFNSCFPLGATASPLIAAYWDDLYPPGGGTVRYETRGTAPNRELVVRWNIPHISATPYVNGDITVVLRERGDIDTCYANTAFGSVYSAGANATVGISGSAPQYLQFSCNMANVPSGLLLLYRHP